MELNITFFERKIFLVISIFCLSQVLTAQSKTADSLENKLRTHLQDDTVKVNLLNKISDAFYKVNVNQSIKYAVESGQLSDQIHFVKGKAESLRLLARNFELRGDYSRSIAIYKQALKIYELLNDQKESWSALYHIGLLNYYMGEYGETMKYYLQSLKLAEMSADRLQILKSYQLYGLICKAQGLYMQALEAYYKALKLAEELGDQHAISDGYMFIATMHEKEGDCDISYEYYQKALKIKLKLPEDERLADCYNNIGILFANKKNYIKALHYYNIALQIGQKLHHYPGVAIYLNNIGLAYQKQNDYAKANEYFQKSLDLSLNFDMKYMICQNYFTIGSLYLLQKKYSSAQVYTRRSLAIAKSLQLLQSQKKCYEQLSNLYAETGDSRKALSYYKLFKQVNDSIFNDTNLKTVEQLEQSYQFEKQKEHAEMEAEQFLAIHQERVKRQRLIINFVILCFIFLTIVVIFIFRLYWLIRKKNVMLNQKNIEIEERNKQLHDLNKEIQAKSEQLEHANTELRKLSVVASESKNGIAIYDASGKIEWFNKGCVDVCGYTKEEYVSKFGENVFQSNAYLIINQAFKTALTTKEPVVYSATFKTKAGKDIWMINTLSPVLNAAGEIVSLVVIGSDITEIKEAEVKIQQQNQEILQKNDELCAQKEELLNINQMLWQKQQEIISQNKKLNELNATKDKFFSIISHDLKSYFSGILAYSDLLVNRPVVPDIKDLLQSVRTIYLSVDNAYKLLENLLEWSKSQTGRIEFCPECLFLGDVFTEAIIQKSALAKSKNIDLVLDLNEDIEVVADAQMLNTVLRNLITNAIKYSHRGGCIVLKGKSVEEGIEISVVDSGVGIEPERLEKLFRIAEKVSTPGTEKEQGSGLGLLVCKEFIEKHSGRIWVESEKNNGSQFIFVIPGVPD